MTDENRHYTDEEISKLLLDIEDLEFKGEDAEKIKNKFSKVAGKVILQLQHERDCWFRSASMLYDCVQYMNSALDKGPKKRKEMQAEIQSLIKALSQD